MEGANQTSSANMQVGQTSNTHIVTSNTNHLKSSRFISPNNLNAINNFADEFNTLANKSFEETRKIRDLQLNVKYPLKAIRIIDTRFGPSAIATLEEIVENVNTNTTNVTFDVYLPKKFNQLKTRLNITNLALVYKGLCNTSINFECHNLEVVSL